MNLRNWSVVSVLALLLALVLPVQNPQTAGANPSEIATLSVVLEDSSGSPLAQGSVNIFKVVGQNKNYVGSEEADDNGNLTFTSSPGVYKVILIPFNDPNGSGSTVSNAATPQIGFTLVVTDSSQVEIHDFEGNLVPPFNGIYTLAAPAGNIFGQVVGSDGSPIIQDWDADLYLDAELQFWNGAYWQSDIETRSYVYYDGYFSLFAPQDGDYRVKILPSGYPDLASTFTNSFSYQTSDGAFDLGQIEPQGPNLGGTVIDPDGNPVQYAQVVPVDEDGMELWDYAGFTDAAGSWQINLPDDGTYEVFAEQPWENTELVRSARFGPITISASVPQSPATDSREIELSLRRPNLEITVYAGASKAVDLWTNILRESSPNYWNWVAGARTDANGVAKFFLDDPESAFSFRAEVGDSPSLRAFYKNTEKLFVDNEIQPVNGVYRASISLEVPNFQASVKTPSGAAVEYGWVELFDAETDFWILGDNTGRNGLVSLNIPVPDSGSKEYSLRVNPGYQSNELSSANRYKLIINGSGQVTMQTLAGSTVATSTIDGRSGVFNLSLLKPNVFGTVYGDSQAIRDTSVVPLSRTAYPEFLWQSSGFTNRDGEFAMNLAEGNYLLQAQTPWGRSGYAPSAKCSFDIVNIGGTTRMAETALANSCDVTNEGISLDLRLPNLSFTLSDNVGNPVPYASVGVGYGNWFTWANSDFNGQVDIFIDSEEIFSLNPQLDTVSDSISLSFWVDPPWGNSDLVRWDCLAGDNKPLCEHIGPVTYPEFASTVIEDSIQFAEPNTKILVTYTQSGSVVGQGAWVSLFQQDPNEPNCEGCRIWLGGAVTDKDGFAAFNLADTSSAAAVSYSIEVAPPWQSRDEYSSKTHFASTYTSLTSSEYWLGTPNFALKVFEQNGSVSKWGWIAVEELDSQGNFVDWIGGFGIDNQGYANMTLPEATTVSLTVYPGPGSNGVPQKCSIYFESSATFSPLACSGQVLATGQPLPSDPNIDFSVNAILIELTSGNVSGIVKHGSSLLSGALIVASSSNEIVKTTADSNGKYGLQLSDGDWEIEIYYVRKPEDDIAIPLFDTFSITVSGEMPNQDFDLAQ